MYKIDAAGHASNEFTNGNPGSGIPATRVDADYMNEVMYEIINVLVAASISPVKGTRTQLRDAINALIAAAGGVPDATTAVKGKVQLADNTEAIAGSNTTKAIVPSSLKAVADLCAKLNSAPTFTGQVSAPSFNTTSARRFKEAIEAIDIAAADGVLDAIELVQYRIIGFDQVNYGVIAEQLLETGMSFAVNVDAEGNAQSVNYTSLFVLAMCSLKHQKAKYADLESRVMKLERQYHANN